MTTTRARWAALLLGVALALGLLSFAPPPARAATTFTVDRVGDAVDLNLTDDACDVSTNSGSQCTLRAAIQQANASSGPDTITVPAGTYNLTIAGQNENAAATGDLDVRDGPTITGAGARDTIIDANGIDRVFGILAGTATFPGVTVRNGNQPSTGGGIDVISEPP